ncbi:DUF6508 domain-containing protein [Niameybacter massiliensis]|uniref:DUF6508 domain-containing protein n=1 Tax=Holtiella tumoricola TaxID=3018743 RepID=A0AA42DNN3_9FIRM|nr:MULTISPECIES: DUF6508 domain-containing protein [Lachnospirales]MDA3732682.1 DUF6508 domain-containing protein [Holtiella tumoricola]
MNNCKVLFKFIPYFEDSTVISLGYRQQDDEITSFVDEVYQCGILNKDYLKILQEVDPTGEYEKLIFEADYETLRVLISFYVCQRNFASTLWETPIKDKTFLRILYRLRTVLGE